MADNSTNGKKYSDTVRSQAQATNGQAVNGGNGPAVIFVASTTPEKLRDLQAVAENRRLPIVFEDIRKLVKVFHSIDEIAGHFSGNAEAKLTGIDRFIYRYRHNPKAIEEYCASNGIAFNPKNIYFATEDTGFSIEKPIWDAVDKDGIPLDKLASIEKQENVSGPGVETGPVISATMGSYNLLQRILKAVDKLGIPDEDVKVFEHSTLTMKGLMDRDTAPPMSFSKSVTNYLYRPDPATIDLLDKKIGTHQYMRCKGMDMSCADMELDYITRYSPRARIVDSIGSRLHLTHNSKAQGPWKPNRKPVEDFTVGLLPTTPEGEELKTLLKQLSSGGHHYMLSLADASYHRDTGRPEDAQSPSTYDLLGGVEHVLQNSDAVMLLPGRVKGDRLSQEEQDLSDFNKLYTLFSLAVAKQLIVRDADKPVVVLNHDGSWDKAIKLHNQLTNLGLTKEYNISWPPPGIECPEGVKVRSNSYFDVVDGDNYDHIRDTAIQILEQKRASYQRIPDNAPSLTEEGGIHPDEFKGFKVALFCSASCENKHLNESVKSIAYNLAKHDFGVVYGGGDRYTMGAVLSGVTSYRKELMDEGMPEEEARAKAYVAGISTEPIIVAESQYGRFNAALSYYKQTEDIYKRMADMLESSDAVVVAPGGAGTVQEWAAILMLKKLKPEVFRDKHIVVYNPPLNSVEQQKVWDHTLTVLMGEEFRDCIEHPERMDNVTRDKFEKRLQELDISIESTKEGVHAKLEQLRSGRVSGHVEGLITRATGTSSALRPH